MGGGTYSSESRTTRAGFAGYETKKVEEIFTQRDINNAMNPYGIKVRESCDSDEHPNSLGIVLGLDVTGSMGSVPHFLIKEGLPNIMDDIISKGVSDPQILFLGIGDHEYDNSPLQVGQFESSDELLDKWLTTVFLEGGGGANEGESYLLAWYFAAFHTKLDCLDKRGKKGFLFTVGDEPVLPGILKNTLRKLMGDGQYNDFSASELLTAASKNYHVYHVHVKETYSGSRSFVHEGWKQILQDNLLMADRSTDIARIISDKIVEVESLEVNIPSISSSVDHTIKEEEMCL